MFHLWRQKNRAQQNESTLGRTRRVPLPAPSCFSSVPPMACTMSASRDIAPKRLLSGEMAYEDISRKESRKVQIIYIPHLLSSEHPLLLWHSQEFLATGLCQRCLTLPGTCCINLTVFSINLVTVDIPMAANYSRRYSWGVDSESNQLWCWPTRGWVKHWVKLNGSLFWLFREVKSYLKLNNWTNKQKEF